MDLAHPQLLELERRIVWFVDHPEFERCVIVEPDSQSIVRFNIPVKTLRGFRSPKFGRSMDLELTPDEAIDGEAKLRKLGFEPHGHRKGTFDGTRNAIFPHFTKQVGKAKQAASDVADVMEDVFALGAAPWLWTFNVDDPDQWPVPLPRPVPWPPAP